MVGYFGEGYGLRYFDLEVFEEAAGAHYAEAALAAEAFYVVDLAGECRAGDGDVAGFVVVMERDVV